MGGTVLFPLMTLNLSLVTGLSAVWLPFNMRWFYRFLKLSQTSKRELFAKIVNCFLPLTIFAKGFILDV